MPGFKTTIQPMNTKSFLYLFTAFLCVQIAPGFTSESSVHETQNVKCFDYGCFGYLSKSFELDPRGDVYECSNGHRFVIRR